MTCKGLFWLHLRIVVEKNLFSCIIILLIMNCSVYTYLMMKTHESRLAWKKSDLSLISHDTLEWLLEKSDTFFSCYERQQITNIRLTNVMQHQHAYWSRLCTTSSWQTSYNKHIYLQMIISLLEHTNTQLDRSSNISKRGLVMKFQLDDESLVVVYLGK